MDVLQWTLVDWLPWLEDRIAGEADAGDGFRDAWVAAGGGAALAHWLLRWGRSLAVARMARRASGSGGVGAESAGPALSPSVLARVTAASTALLAIVVARSGVLESPQVASLALAATHLADPVWHPSLRASSRTRTPEAKGWPREVRRAWRRARLHLAALVGAAAARVHLAADAEDVVTRALWTAVTVTADDAIDGDAAGGEEPVSAPLERVAEGLVALARAWPESAGARLRAAGPAFVQALVDRARRAGVGRESAVLATALAALRRLLGG